MVATRDLPVTLPPLGTLAHEGKDGGQRQKPRKESRKLTREKTLAKTQGDHNHNWVAGTTRYVAMVPMAGSEVWYQVLGTDDEVRRKAAVRSAAEKGEVT